MLKKSLNILTALMLLITTTGMVVHRHYCRGNLVESSFAHEPKSCCGDDSDCCSNESELYQLDNDYTFSQQFTDLNQFEFELPLIYCDIFFVNKSESTAEKPFKIFRPPDRSDFLASIQTYRL